MKTGNIITKERCIQGGKVLAMAVAAAGLMAVSTHAFAAGAAGQTTAPQNLTGLFNNWMNIIQIGKKLALMVFFMIGVVLFCTGLWLFYKDTKEPGRGHAKNGAVALLIGVCLLGATTLIKYSSNSFFGSGGSSASQNVTAGSNTTQY